MKYLGYNQKGDQWDRVLEYIGTRPSRISFHNDLLLLGFSFVVYLIWWERNARIFNRKERVSGDLVLDAKNRIRLSVCRMERG